MLEWRIFNIVVLLVCFTAVGAWYGFGPVLWVRRQIGRRRAEEGTDRRELVRRVQELLPQANDSNVLFSMYNKSDSSGGVTSLRYSARVFVADGTCLWVIPLEYHKKKRKYELGSPSVLSEASIERVSLGGKKDKALTYTFWIDTGKHTLPLEMVVERFCFRRNSFYPFDLVQQAACEKAAQAAEGLARRACGMTAEDLENGRLKEQGTGYGIYAVCSGFLGFLCATGGFLPAVILFFAVALILLILSAAHGRIPKISALLVIVELVAAWRVYEMM